MRKLTPIELEAFSRSAQGDLQPLRDLLADDPSIALVSTGGRTPLHDAAYCGDLDLMEQLLELGCPVEPPESQGLAPLHCAVLKEQLDAARFLLSRDASVNRLDQNGCTALHQVVCRAPWLYGENVTLEQIALTRLLLGHGADPNLRAPARSVGYDGSCLEFAVLRKNLELAELLWDWGAEGDLVKLAGPLVAALLYRRPELGETLNATACSVLIQDAAFYPQGHPEIHQAVIENDIPRLQAGVAGGWDVKAVNRGGCSALHLAALVGNKTAAHFLLEYGGDPMLAAPGGETPSQLARETGHTEVAKLLDHSKSLLQKAASDDVEAIKRELERRPGLLTWSQTGSGTTLLHVASYENALGVARLLLERGTDPDQQDAQGYAALHFVGHSKEMARLLLEYGARVNLPATDRSLPVRHTSGEARQFLLSQGADPSELTTLYCDMLCFAICHTGHLDGWKQEADDVIFQFSCVKLLLHGQTAALRVRLEKVREAPPEPFPTSCWLRLGALRITTEPFVSLSMQGCGRYVAERLVLEDQAGSFPLEAVEARHQGWVEAYKAGELGDDPASRLTIPLPGSEP